MQVIGARYYVLIHVYWVCLLTTSINVTYIYHIKWITIPGGWSKIIFSRKYSVDTCTVTCKVYWFYIMKTSTFHRLYAITIINGNGLVMHENDYLWKKYWLLVQNFDNIRVSCHDNKIKFVDMFIGLQEFLIEHPLWFIVNKNGLL